MKIAKADRTAAAACPLELWRRPPVTCYSGPRFISERLFFFGLRASLGFINTDFAGRFGCY